MERVAPRIRAVVLGIVWRGDQLLVVEGADSVKGDSFFRPPGGGIEFGEPASEALARELMEELSAEVHVRRQIGVFENIFTYQEEIGHDVVFLFETAFKDLSLYELDSLPLNESGWESDAIWRPLASFGPGGKRLVPEGLYDILSRELAAR